MNEYLWGISATPAIFVFTNTTSNDSDILKDYFLPLLPSLLTIVGWIVVYRSERKANRENLNLIREEKLNTLKHQRITKAIEIVEDVKALAEEYYTRDGSDVEAPKYVNTIQTRITLLRHFIIKIYEPNQLPGQMTSQIIKFRQSVTGGDFGSQTRRAIGFTDLTFIDIASEAVKLQCKLESEYY